MPTKSVYVKPEHFLSYRGVHVYRCYKGDDIEDVMTYWFTLDPDNSDSEMAAAGGPFDVRDLSTWTAHFEANTANGGPRWRDGRFLAIRAAIASGELGGEAPHADG